MRPALRFMDEEIQRREVICPNSHSKIVAAPRLELLNSLSTYYVLGTLLDGGNTAVNKTDNRHELTI